MDRLKFYVLISGNLTLDSKEGDHQMLNVCENLDWKRQFGLHLWYKSLPINSIHDSLDSFEKSLSSNVCNKPLPPYLEDSATMDSDKTLNLTLTSKINSSVMDKMKFKSGFGSFNTMQMPEEKRELYDTCFHLLKLYCDDKYSLADIISPLNHNSNQMDYRLSWHLAMALVSLNKQAISRGCLETLHESYALQLQTIGLWHWSIFILMHINDDSRRETIVKNYISRFVTSNSELNDKEQFLIEKLSVPSEWIFSYKALKAKYENLHDNQFKLLLKAHKWNEAHTVLIELLAPDLFIKQNLKTLSEYLSPLAKENESINKWNLGGQVYLDFIRLNQKAQVLFDFSRGHQEEEEQVRFFVKLLSTTVLKIT